MEYKLDKKSFVKSMRRVQSVVSSPSSVPLSYALLVSREGRLEIKATDAEVYWQETLETKSGGIDGSIAVKAKRLFDVVNSLPEGEVSCYYQKEKNKLNLVIDKSHFELVCLPEREFPIFPEESSTHSFSIKAKDLLALIEKTSFAINPQTHGLRFHFSGLLLEVLNGKIRSIATNNHRLSVCHIDAPANSEVFPASIIPRKAILALEGLLRELDKNNEVKIFFNQNAEQNNLLTFELNDIRIITKLISGTFQNLDKTIELVSSKVEPFDIDVKSLIEVASRISGISDQSHKAINIHISSNNLKIDASSSINDTAQETIAIKNSSPEQISLSINAQYLIECLKSFNVDKCQIWVPDNKKEESKNWPILIGEGAGIFHVIMPLRLNSRDIN